MSELPLYHQSDDLTVNNLGIGGSSLTNFSDNTAVDSTIPDEVDLIDISSNKKWICFVHYTQNGGDVKITRRRLKVFNKEKNKEEYIPADDTENEDSAINICEQLSTTKANFDLNKHYHLMEDHSRFLSISPSGNFIALSCYKGFEERRSSSCIIFKVMTDEIVYYTEMKHRNGRAVFLDRKKGLCLAIINQERLEIYTKFSKHNTSPNYFYDLVGTSKQYLLESKAYQKSFFKNATWACISNKGKAEIVLTLSRHIRYNVLVTPFVDEGIVRLWSIEDGGVRLTSFSAPNEHVVALSKDLKYAATVRDGVRAVKIYNIKNGLLVYTLQSCFTKEKSLLEVTHVRFCFGSRYLALSGLQETLDGEDKLVKTEVVFEVWYIEAEKSIYGKILDPGEKYDFKAKTVKPFVLRDLKEKEGKCLKGVYTFTNDQKENKINCLQLKIDEELSSDNSRITVEWLENDTDGNKIKPFYVDYYEIRNDVDNSKYLRCADITLKGKRFHIRFGNRMIQLWIPGDPNASNGQEQENRLVYIRAYKSPSYGVRYSFRDTWKIKDFNSIRFIEGTPTGRIILNIKHDEKNLTVEDKKELKDSYHTEEIFLPLTNDDEGVKKFDYHTFESACQALHYLNWCWGQKQLINDQQEEQSKIDISGWDDCKADISSWDKDKDGYKEKVEFELKLLDYSKDEKSNRRNMYEKNIKYKKNLQNLFFKTLEIIKKAVDESNYEESNYFATMAGSRTLAMLADFPKGREIIKLLLKRKDSITFSIFSYTKQIPSYHSKDIKGKARTVLSKRTISRPFHVDLNAMHYRGSPEIEDRIVEKFTPISENENMLTVLIDNLEYDLYELMFNRILSDSKKIGPGCLSALADALLFLQYEGHTDLLLSSSQKLSYLAMDINVLGVLTREKREIIEVDEYDSKIRNLECHSTMEQLEKCNLNFIDYLYYKVHAYYPYHPGIQNDWGRTKTKWINDSKKYVQLQVKKYVVDTFRALFDISSKSDSKDRTKLCVIPLPYFNTYNILLEDRTKNNVIEDRVYKNRSAFVAIASNQNSSNIFRQGDTVLEVMLQYKWRKFLRIRFICVCLISVAYYISYCTAVLFALELYDYRSENEDRFISIPHMVSIICMSVSGSLLLFQEIRQIIISKKWMDYLSSGYNWVDFAAFTLPPLTLVQLVKNWDYFYEACSVTTLVLWLRIIIRLRVISFVGITLETIIQLSRKVWSILFIFLLVVLAFTSSFIVLFRQREDTYFQETFHGITSMYSSDTPTNGQIPITVGNTTLHDVSSDNGFADPFKAFYQVWLVIFGVWDPLINGEAGDDKMVFILCMLFALITVLIFTNMVIALMSSTVDEVKNRGKTVWVSHFASVVAEMEQLWCLPNTKRNRNNNPTYMYYTANHGAVKKQEEKLEQETEELRKRVLGLDL